MNDPETPEQLQDERHENEERRDRPPFDTSELNSIPHATEDDPPYRNWWVVADSTPRFKSRRKPS